MKPTAPSGDETPAATLFDPHTPPAPVAVDPDTFTDPSLAITLDAAHPPLTLVTLRTVVLLI